MSRHLSMEQRRWYWDHPHGHLISHLRVSGWMVLASQVSLLLLTNPHLPSLGQTTNDSSREGCLLIGQFSSVSTGKAQKSHGVMSNQAAAGRVISNKPWLASMGLTPHPSPHKSSRVWWHRGLVNKAVNWTRRKRSYLRVSCVHNYMPICRGIAHLCCRMLLASNNNTNIYRANMWKVTVHHCSMQPNDAKRMSDIVRPGPPEPLDRFASSSLLPLSLPRLRVQSPSVPPSWLRTCQAHVAALCPDFRIKRSKSIQSSQSSFSGSSTVLPENHELFYFSHSASPPQSSRRRCCWPPLSSEWYCFAKGLALYPQSSGSFRGSGTSLVLSSPPKSDAVNRLFNKKSKGHNKALFGGTRVHFHSTPPAPRDPTMTYNYPNDPPKAQMRSTTGVWCLDMFRVYIKSRIRTYNQQTTSWSLLAVDTWQLMANRQVATVCATSTTGLTFQAPAMAAAGAAPVTALCASTGSSTWTSLRSHPDFVSKTH